MMSVKIHLRSKINGQSPNVQNFILLLAAIRSGLRQPLILRLLYLHPRMPVLHIEKDRQRQKDLGQNKQHDQDGLPGFMHPDMIG